MCDTEKPFNANIDSQGATNVLIRVAISATATDADLLPRLPPDLRELLLEEVDERGERALLPTGVTCPPVLDCLGEGDRFFAGLEVPPVLRRNLQRSF